MEERRPWRERWRSSWRRFSAASASAGPRYSMVEAQATADYKAIKVGKGETVELPFGPPYKPVVTVPPYWTGQGQGFPGNVAGGLGR